MDRKKSVQKDKTSAPAEDRFGEGERLIPFRLVVGIFQTLEPGVAPKGSRGKNKTWSAACQINPPAAFKKSSQRKTFGNWKLNSL
jgi:hypothetical protein